VIRNAKSGFRDASRRWSGTDQSPQIERRADKPKKSIARALRDGIENVGAGVFLIALMVVYGLALPAIKLGLFHFLSWKAYKENGLATGFAVFALSCLVIDIGLIWGAVLVAQGKLRVW
jgi:hypothetical protein